MPLFDYAGQLQSGAAFQGTLEADSQQHAERMLADMGVRVASLRPAKRNAYVAPLSPDDFLFFNEQIAAMAKAGVPLQEGLRNLAADVGSRKLKRLLLDLADDLSSGTPLEQAIEKLGARFPVQYAPIVQAGVRSGDFGATLHALSAHLRLKSETRRALIELSAYPLMVLAFAFAIVDFLMRFVAPQLEAIIADMLGHGSITSWSQYRAVSLPRASLLVFDIAHSWRTIELVFLAIVATLVILWLLTYLPGGRRAREWIIRRIPAVAQVYWSSVLARFTHTSAIAAFSGTPMHELIAAGGQASGSPALARATKRVAGKLREGASLEKAARDQSEIPALWTCVANATAARGELPGALEELAKTYETRARHWASAVRLILGPVLLIIVGMILGSVIIGMLLPIVRLIQGLTA